MKSNFITIEYTEGLRDYLDINNHKYVEVYNQNGYLYFHIYCSGIPTSQDIWNLANDFLKYNHQIN